MGAACSAPPSAYSRNTSTCLLSGQLEGEGGSCSLPILRRGLCSAALDGRPSRRVVGGHKQMSQPCASRCLPHFLDAMLQHSQTFIKLPNTLQQQQKVNEGLYVIASFLSIQGVIDCIHIPTVAPVDNEMYRSRKPSHSMNMQVVHGARNIITNVHAKYPGSSQNAFIFQYRAR